MGNGALSQSFRRRGDWVDRLAKLTGRSQALLALALPEVADVQTGPHAQRRVRSLARPDHARPYCQRCAASKQATQPVSSWLPVAYRVCIQHRTWIDWTTWQKTSNTEISTLPEVIHAQRRLNRLISRYPSAAINKALGDADDIMHYWSDRASWGEELRQDRYNRLWRPAGPGSSWSVGSANVGRHIANFPETVTLTGIFLSSVWRQEAALSEPTSLGKNTFVAELGRRFAMPRFAPGRARDHLAKWIESRQHEYHRYARARRLLCSDHEAVAQLDQYYDPLRHDWWTEPPLGPSPNDRDSTRWRVRYAYYDGYAAS